MSQSTLPMKIEEKKPSPIEHGGTSPAATGKEPEPPKGGSGVPEKEKTVGSGITVENNTASKTKIVLFEHDVLRPGHGCVFLPLRATEIFRLMEVLDCVLNENFGMRETRSYQTLDDLSVRLQKLKWSLGDKKSLPVVLSEREYNAKDPS